MGITNRSQSSITPQEQRTDYLVGTDLLGNLHELDLLKNLSAGDILYLTDSTILPLYGEIITPSLKKIGKPIVSSVIDPGEKSKSLNEIPQIVRPFMEHGFNRESVLIAVGGGVITDLGGFIASILLRGIRYINIPTTLLGQLDASIGGKTGVDFWVEEPIGNIMYKNMLGRIEQPQLVISDIDVLKTLPERELKSGLGEMVKYWIGWGKPNTNIISAGAGLRPGPDISSVIAICQQIKIETIQEDPYETKGIRDRLNLGHTFGHAIESAAKGSLSHGEAVAIGLVAAARLSVLVGYLKDEVYNKIKATVASLGLPTTCRGGVLPPIKKEHILNAMKMDKKGGTFVLIRDIGKLETRVSVEQKYIEQVIEEILNSE